MSVISINYSKDRLCEMQKGAMTVIECANVCLGERVLILTDTGINFSVSSSIYQAALDVGAEPSMVMSEPRKYPTAPVKASVKVAMLASDVIICPTSTRARAPYYY